MYQNLQPGDSLFRKKGAIVHQGVYVIDGLVAHQGPLGIRIEPLEMFANGQQVWPRACPVPLTILLERLEQAVRDASPYNVISNNCEHLARFLQTGTRGSRQLAGSLAGGAIGLGLALANDHSPLEAAGFTCIGLFVGEYMARPRRRSVTR